MWKYERIFTAVAMTILIIISACIEFTQPENIKSQVYAQFDTAQSQFAQFNNRQAEAAQSNDKDDLIRLHVIANSDSPEDQALKLKVRDRLLLDLGESFKEAQTMEQARETIQANLSKIENTALAEVTEQGYNYQVEAQLGVWPFPTRVYGDEVYPAGEYEALRLVIGEGKGANWWCVMFPPLCFVDVSSSVAEKAEQNSQFQPEQNSSADKQETLVYTFKLVELWKSFKQWLNNIFS